MRKLLEIAFLFGAVYSLHIVLSNEMQLYYCLRGRNVLDTDFVPNFTTTIKYKKVTHSYEEL